jgi:hypothetical protein
MVTIGVVFFEVVLPQLLKNTLSFQRAATSPVLLYQTVPAATPYQQDLISQSTPASVSAITTPDKIRVEKALPVTPHRKHHH